MFPSLTVGWIIIWRDEYVVGFCVYSWGEHTSFGCARFVALCCSSLWDIRRCWGGWSGQVLWFSLQPWVLLACGPLRIVFFVSKLVVDSCGTFLETRPSRNSLKHQTLICNHPFSTGTCASISLSHPGPSLCLAIWLHATSDGAKLNCYVCCQFHRLPELRAMVTRSHCLERCLQLIQFFTLGQYILVAGNLANLANLAMKLSFKPSLFRFFALVLLFDTFQFRGVLYLDVFGCLCSEALGRDAFAFGVRLPCLWQLLGCNERESPLLPIGVDQEVKTSRPEAFLAGRFLISRAVEIFAARIHKGRGRVGATRKRYAYSLLLVISAIFSISFFIL